MTQNPLHWFQHLIQMFLGASYVNQNLQSLYQSESVLCPLLLCSSHWYASFLSNLVFLSADISGEAFWCSLASSWMFTVKTARIWSFPLWRTLGAGYWRERKSSFSRKMCRRCLQGYIWPTSPMKYTRPPPRHRWRTEGGFRSASPPLV